MEIGVDGLDEYVEGGPSLEATGLPDGEDSLDPAVPLVAGRALHHLAPEHGKPQGPLGPVIGGLNAILEEKEPELSHELFDVASESARFVFSVPVLSDQMHHAGIPGARLAFGGWSVCPGDEPVKLGEHPLAEPGLLGIRSFRKAPGPADQVSKAGLLLVDPVAVDPVAIGDQDSGPLVDQGLEGLLGSTGQDLEESHVLACHHPEPHQKPLVVPGGLVDVVDFDLTGGRGNGVIERLDGLRCPVNGSLDATTADGDAQNGLEEGLNRASAVAIRPGELGDERCESWPIAINMVLGNAGLDELAALRTDALEKRKMGDVQLNGRKLNFLVRVVWMSFGKTGIATFAPLGFDRNGLAGIQ